MLSSLQRRPHELQILRAGCQITRVSLELLVDLLQLSSVGDDSLLCLLRVLPSLGLLDFRLGDLVVGEIDHLLGSVDLGLLRTESNSSDFEDLVLEILDGFLDSGGLLVKLVDVLGESSDVLVESSDPLLVVGVGLALGPEKSEKEEDRKSADVLTPFPTREEVEIQLT